jgi:serine/threonine protein kinase
MLFRGQTIGKYRIVSPLGSGGFGAVYLAEDTWIDKKVAIKVPHRQNRLRRAAEGAAAAGQPQSPEHRVDH